MPLPRAEFDSPWKRILDTYFRQFMEMCHPEAAAAIDWSKGYESLDKELNAISKDAKTGKRVVDKLMKVWRKDGEEAWVLFHLDLQAQKQILFPERMYTYNYRLYDRYRKPIVSIAILADEHAEWRPASYEQGLWGCHLRFDFVCIKLLDYEKQSEELAKSTNPFAWVIQAHLAALKTKGDVDRRYKAKIKLTYDLYKRGWQKQEILDLYTFLDYVLALPEALELNYLQEIEQFEEENKMPYITSAERLGMKRGRKEGIEIGREKGRQEGRQEGRAEMQKSIAVKMLQQGINQTQVAKATGLSPAVIKTLSKKPVEKKVAH